MKDHFSEYADKPESADKQPITEEGSPEGQGDSIHIPAEFLQANAGKFKEGDELILKVVAVDDDGSVEVEYASEPAKGDESEGGGSDMGANAEIDQMHGSGGGY